MQGFILRTQPVRDEDLLVSILTQNELVLAYRFYGARHASITRYILAINGFMSANAWLFGRFLCV